MGGWDDGQPSDRWIGTPYQLITARIIQRLDERAWVGLGIDFRSAYFAAFPTFSLASAGSTAGSTSIDAFTSFLLLLPHHAPG